MSLTTGSDIRGAGWIVTILSEIVQTGYRKRLLNGGAVQVIFKNKIASSTVPGPIQSGPVQSRQALLEGIERIRKSSSYAKHNLSIAGVTTVNELPVLSRCLEPGTRLNRVQTGSFQPMGGEKVMAIVNAQLPPRAVSSMQ